MSTNTVKIKCAYDNTDFTRVYQFDNVPNSKLGSVKSGVLTVNSKLAAARDESTQFADDYNMRAAFISDDYDPANGVGYFKEIVEAEIIVVEETKIPLF